MRSRGIFAGLATKHIESQVERQRRRCPTIASGAQQRADRRGDHYASSHHPFSNPVSGCSWHRARLLRSADGSFNSGVTANCRRCEYCAGRIATDGGIALTIRRSHTRRSLRDERGPVLRHVRGQRPVANEGTVPTLGRRPNRVRSWPTRVSGRTMVGRFEWKRHAGRRGSLLPVSTAAAGTAHTVDQTCSARGAHGSSRAEHFVKAGR